MVEFNVAQLLREPIGARREYHVEQRYQRDDGASADISGEASLLRTDRSILVEAHLRTMAAADCSRCLAPARSPVTLDLEEEYYPTVDVLSGATLPPLEDTSALRIDSHHLLDLDEAIRQHLVLAEPMQPLCRPDCAGLCLDCGADLNEGDCRCTVGPIDSRWSALRQVGNDSA